eukprot:9480834-Pyramimonas_sp.AAC.1
MVHPPARALLHGAALHPEHGALQREEALRPPSSFGPVAHVAVDPLRPAVAAALVEVVVQRVQQVGRRVR